MKTSMTIETSRLRQFQELVKRHNFRFRGDPMIFTDRAIVSIDGDHLPMTVCNEFFADWYRLTTPIVEKTSPRWKQLLRRIGLRF